VTQKLVRDLVEERLDLALVALPVSEPALAEHPLFDEEFLVVGRKIRRGSRCRH
jgi:LysR family hydrogen peroxide-inducible transcriptional activator